jgi:hypothetical protein
MEASGYSTLRVEQLTAHVVHVEIHRPDNLNTMNFAFWEEGSLKFLQSAGLLSYIFLIAAIVFLICCLICCHCLPYLLPLYFLLP